MALRATITLCVLGLAPSSTLLACGSGPRTEVQSAVIGAPNAPTPGWTDAGAPLAPTAPPRAERPLGEAMTFGHPPLRVGDKFEEQTSNAYTMTMRIGSVGASPQVTSIENTERETKQVEVLAVAKDAITKLRVNYTEKSTIVGMGGTNAPSPAPIAGKTYVVEAKDGKTTVLSDHASAPPSAEVAAVLKDHRRLGKPDAIALRMPERPLHIGEVVPELAQAVSEELGEDNMKPAAVRVMLRERKGDAGVFELTLTLTRDEGMMSFSVTLSGQMTLRTSDAQMTSVDLTGPLVIAPSATALGVQGPQPTSVEGDGRMELHVRRVYSGSR
ncbi:MAG: hypothetical protein JWM74_287 [Myxococcaceae bacterium]|nr:hypothetical protein [Myxococcaceae bacterium]